jgi:hypothetical protein
LQETKESFKELNAKKQKQMMIPDVDLWLSRNDLPKDLKTVIMDNIHKLENNKVINVQSILSVLPIHDKNRIVDSLCMASLRKVRTFFFFLSNYRSIGRKIIYIYIYIYMYVYTY